MTTLSACRRCRLHLPSYMMHAGLCQKCREESAREVMGKPRLLRTPDGREWVSADQVRRLVQTLMSEAQWLEEHADGRDAWESELFVKRATELRSILGEPQVHQEGVADDGDVT